MVYKIEKDSPYNHKKVSFGKRLRSTIVTLLACGIVITLGGRFANLYLISQNEEQYETTISYYDELVDMVVSYMKNNDGDNPENCFKLYTKLLWNGYFSKSGKYTYNINNQNNIMGYNGARIATGVGDCKNNEDFFCRIMKKLGYNAYIVACSQNADSLVSSVLGNHIITVVEDNGVEYFFDTTNACSYKKVGTNYAKNDEKNLTVQLKPFVSYICGYNDEDSTIHLMFETSNTESGEAFTVSEQLNVINNPKILVLRKAIMPKLKEICSAIVKEGKE